MKQRNAARYIRTIERMHSISGAAEELGISQPALSSFLKKAEERLGTAIFDRSSTPLSLTDAGRAYLEYEDGVERLEGDLKRKISDIEDLRCGTLSVGATASLSITFLPRAVASFAKRYPGIEVSVIADTLPELARAAIRGDIDLFVASSLQDNGAFDFIELAHERFFLCIPREWEVCERLPEADERGFAPLGPKQFALLDGLRFISMQEDQQIGRKLDELLEHYGITPGQIIRVNQALTSLALTEEGLGISLVTEGALNCLNPESLPALYLPDAQACTRMLYLAKPNNRTISRAAEEFVKMMLAETRNRQ